MDTQKAEAAAFSQKVKAQLDQVAATISGAEATAKGKAAQDELDAIKKLKTMKDVVAKKHEELTTASDAKIAQTKSELEAQVTQLHASMESFSKKFHAHAKTT